MEHERINKLAKDVVDAARPSLTAKEADTLDGLLGHAEPGLAIMYSLDYAVEGRWTVPSDLAARLRELLDTTPTPADWVRTIESALALADV